MSYVYHLTQLIFYADVTKAATKEQQVTIINTSESQLLELMPMLAVCAVFMSNYA
jgi:hypothetical protein